MTAAIGHLELKLKSDQPTDITPRDVILLRIAAGGATRADLQRDVATLLTKRMSGTEFRQSAELAISSLTGSNLVTETKGRLAATPKGLESAMAALRPARPADLSWAEIRTALLLRALSATDTPAIRKALQRVEGLSALVLQHHFGKPTDRVRSPANLRADLAIVALERAFGNKIKTGLTKGAGLPAKAGRLLAGQLFKSPRELASDGKLIIQLACEIAGIRDAALPALELAVLRSMFAPAETPENAPAAKRSEQTPTERRAPRRETPRAANDPAPMSGAAPAQKISPPDMAEFCRAVVDAARPVAEGWPGNRKAFISLVWKAIRHSRPDWGLSEIAFKGMLAEAHRSGQIELATADLKDGRDLTSLEDSKILYKNTVWHFVRVQD
ncbi:hypothetical protein DLM45_09670 [Hyphomicrobium methylovorum]|uniref:hypothetical protein n=1 Tax=Hyphomicrobium methylovorum TaxID=84 RepID=UPI0015E65B2D|nr:hypothetical protein [Hyphomicrobium methylovorum]MBA2126486.1 hypothetical protein [Hyphomicrobium methylovorum]